MLLINATRQSVVAEQVDVADTVWRRLVGLLGRKELPPGRALVIEPCSSIHTCFMRFALDVIFLDDRDRVVRVVRDLVPWRVAGARGSRKVIEMAAGSLSADLEDGHQLRFERQGPPTAGC